MSRKQLEKRYAVKIVNDNFYNPRTGKMVKCYKIYSADGCPWENGLPTLEAVRKECEEWEPQLKRIAERIGKRV